jgi:hypothetical protein
MTNDPICADGSPPAENQIANAVTSFKTAYETAEGENSHHQGNIFFWTKGAAIGVFVYTALTLFILVATVCQTKIANDTFIAATRAWVIPTGAHFDGAPKVGFDQRFKVTFENVGKEAASDVIIFANVGDVLPVKIDARKMPYIDVQTVRWPINNACRSDPSRYANRRAVYPSTKNEQITYGFTDPPYFPRDVLDGKQFFTIFGCIVYRSSVTKNEIHHSPFCLYLQPKRGEPIQNWTFEFCQSGSANAD